jgi:hypothetical protein
LVVAELDQHEGPFEGQVILPGTAATLIRKLIGRNDIDYVKLFIQANTDADGKKQPADLCVAGPDWILWFKEVEGHFPLYRDVVPRSHSRFVVDRRGFIDTVGEVAISTDVERKGVRLDLTADSVRVSARGAEGGESTGTVDAEFIGGGDDRIISGFNPEFLLDACKTLADDRVVIDVEQNHHSRPEGTVIGRPGLIYGADSPRIRWLLMPLNLGLPASRETLGSNFSTDEKAKPAKAEAPPASPQPTATTSSSQDVPSRRRQKVDHPWPEIGTRMDGQFLGETYAALMVAAPKLKSGRALQVINGPAFGQTFRSMTAAMLAVTAKQRQKLGQGTSKKGLPKSGWDFWHEPSAKRLSA